MQCWYINIYRQANWLERIDYDVMRALNFRLNSLKRHKKLFRLPGFSCFINTTAEVSESRKAGMHQRPLSGATFVLIKEKHANVVKQNESTREKNFIPSLC